MTLIFSNQKKATNQQRIQKFFENFFLEWQRWPSTYEAGPMLGWSPQYIAQELRDMVDAGLVELTGNNRTRGYIFTKTI